MRTLWVHLSGFQPLLILKPMEDQQHLHQNVHGKRFISPMLTMVKDVIWGGSVEVYVESVEWSEKGSIIRDGSAPSSSPSPHNPTDKHVGFPNVGQACNNPPFSPFYSCRKPVDPHWLTWSHWGARRSILTWLKRNKLGILIQETGEKSHADSLDVISAANNTHVETGASSPNMSELHPHPPGWRRK